MNNINNVDLMLRCDYDYAKRMGSNPTSDLFFDLIDVYIWIYRNQFSNA